MITFTEHDFFVIQKKYLQQQWLKNVKKDAVVLKNAYREYLDSNPLKIPNFGKTISFFKNKLKK